MLECGISLLFALLLLVTTAYTHRTHIRAITTPPPNKTLLLLLYTPSEQRRHISDGWWRPHLCDVCPQLAGRGALWPSLSQSQFTLISVLTPATCSRSLYVSSLLFFTGLNPRRRPVSCVTTSHPCPAMPAFSYTQTLPRLHCGFIALPLEAENWGNRAARIHTEKGDAVQMQQSCAQQAGV